MTRVFKPDSGQALEIQDEGGSTALTIDTSGQVGIGTASPGYQVDIQDTGESGTQLRVETAYDAPAGLRLEAGNGGSSQIYFGDQADNDVGRIIYNHTSDYLRFDVNASERMRIDSSGNFTGSSSADISDQRLKENITDLMNSLEKISQLRGVRYTWKKEANKDLNVPYYGLLAQELESVIPELVWNHSIHDIEPIYWKEGDDLPENVEVGDIKKEGFKYKSIHLTGLIPFLIEAIKELSTKITALENA